MRKSSVIALIVGAAIMLAGVILALVGFNMAKSQDVPIYEDNFNEEGHKVEKYDLGQYNNKNTLNINIRKAKVVVMFSEDDSYVEMSDFANYTYSFSSDSNAIDIRGTEGNPLASFRGITRGHLDFKGLRFFLRLDAFKDAEQRVTVYLNSNKVASLRDLNINLEEGAVFVKGFEDAPELHLNINVNKGDVTLNKISEADADIRIGEGNLETLRVKLDKANIDIKNGSANAEIVPGSKVSAELGNGSLTVDGKETETPYSDVYGNIKSQNKSETVLKIENGSAALRKTEYQPPADKTEETDKK